MAEQQHSADVEGGEEPQPMNAADVVSVEQQRSEGKTAAAHAVCLTTEREPAEGPCPPEDDDPVSSSTPQLHEGRHEEEEPVSRAAETTSPTLCDRNDDGIDGPEEATKDGSEAAEGDGPVKEEKKAPSSQTEAAAESIESIESIENTENIENIESIENIGPTTEDSADPEPAAPVAAGKHGSLYLVAAVLGIVLAILGQHLFTPDSPPQKDAVRQIDVFVRQLEKTKTEFPRQRDEVWTRSKIHLLRHLQTAQPSEPVSLMLTAGRRAERTLRCLAHSLASAFSSSLNASVLHIDGAGEAGQDSDRVKLDIDSKLQRAFEGDKPVAVINRFDELPPGSTLIFYRYCDHENAAYKRAGLIFTVLLGDEDDIPAGTRLSAVEEMVDDHLQKKFLSSGHPVSFDRMDLDKYGGLWSRISHLILPVAAEERVERGGC